VTGLPPVTWRDSARVERVIRGDDKRFSFLDGKPLIAFQGLALVTAHPARAVFRLFFESGNKFWVEPARAGKVVVMLVAIFGQPALQMSPNLVSSICSRSHAFHLDNDLPQRICMKISRGL
jgi:hypothetical protein